MSIQFIESCGIEMAQGRIYRKVSEACLSQLTPLQQSPPTQGASSLVQREQGLRNEARLPDGTLGFLSCFKGGAISTTALSGLLLHPPLQPRLPWEHQEPSPLWPKPRNLHGLSPFSSWYPQLPLVQLVPPVEFPASSMSLHLSSLLHPSNPMTLTAHLLFLFTCHRTHS